VGRGECRGLIGESIDAGKGLAILRNVRLQKERPLPVIQGSRGATVLVGMDGFVVGVEEIVDGELWLFIETTTDVIGCARCGTRAVGHGRSRTAVRDLPVAGRPTVLVWAKRRWRCPDLDCPIGTWSETTDEIAPRASAHRTGPEASGGDGECRWRLDRSSCRRVRGGVTHRQPSGR